MLNEPVIGKDFFGRDAVLALLEKRVNALKEGYRQNIALTGQNLAGKSSILHHFLNNFCDNQILPIYVEVTDEPFVYFCQRFAGSLLYNFLKLKALEPKEDLALLLETARAFIPRTVKSITEIEDLIKKKETDEAYSLLFDLTSVVKEETGKACVIILDEFHNLAALDVKHPFRIFGKKIMVQKDTMYIVTSSQVTTIKKILDEKLSLLFGNFEIIKINGFTKESASALLGQRFKYVRVPDEYRDFIVSFTEGNPFYLDAISQAVRDIVITMTFRRVTPDVLIEALTKTVFNSKGCVSQYLNGMLDIIKTKKGAHTYINILIAASNGHLRLNEMAKTLKKSAADLSRYAAELVEMNMLFKNGSFYRFVDPMLGFWLKYVYQKKRSALISYLPDRIRIFKEEMKGVIDAFLADEKKDPVERVAALFMLFNNETVSIAEKECRLPAFTGVDIKYFENETPYILAGAKNRYWLAAMSAGELKDIDIMEFTERTKSLKTKLACRIFITPYGADTNARLMAKEENIPIWDLEALNELFSLYGKMRIVNFAHNKNREKPVCE